MSIHSHVLGAMVGEDAPDVLQQSDGFLCRNTKCRQSYQPLNNIAQDIGGDSVVKGASHEERHEEENADAQDKRHGEDDSHQPGRHVLLGPGLILHGYGGGTVEGLNPQSQRLYKDQDSA